MGAARADRPTVGKMMSRDVFSYVSIATPVMWLLVTFLMSSTEQPAGETEATDTAYMYAFFVALVGVTTVLLYWRWSMYSSILASGVEVPGEVSSVRRSGDSVIVEYTYRWQAETMRSTKKIGGYIPKRRFKEQVGAKATLLVDPAKPMRFLVMDTIW